jgi:hypothetical protein
LESRLSFVHWRISWRFADEGMLQVSDFFLPNGEEPNKHVEDLINIVELSASEYGYIYSLVEMKDGEVMPTAEALLAELEALEEAA